MSALDTRATGQRLPLWFDVPEQFTDIDLAEEPERRAERTRDQIAHSMPYTSEEQRLHLLLVQQLIIDRMTDNGVVYAATLLARDDADGSDGTRLTTAQFTVSVQPVDGVGPQTLQTMAERMRREDLRRDVGFVPLRAGRALAVVEDRELTLPATVLGGPGENTHLIRQLQLILPFPDGQRVAIFAISTECLLDWDDYVDIMGSIASTISFSPPGDGANGDKGPVSIQDVLDGGASG